MKQKRLAWLRSHPKTCLALMLFAAFLALNALACLHARAMTHFVADGIRTQAPEDLTLWQKFRVLFVGVTLPKPTNGDITPASRDLPYEAHRFASADGIELEAWRIPRAETRALVLMFHGYLGCKAGLLGEAAAFHALGYEPLLVDFRGSGGSSGTDTTIGVREADDVIAAFDYVQKRWPERPVVLYGQSMGSAAILRALALHSHLRIEAAIVECPFDSLLNTVGNRFRAMGLPAFPGAQLLIFWASVQQGFNGFGHNPAEYAEQVECPVLLLHGADDPRVTLEQAEAIYNGLPRGKQMKVFADAGHELYLARQPEEWKRVVGEFLIHNVPQAQSRGKQ